MVIYLKPMSHQSGVLTAFPQQTPATLDRPTDRRTDATKRIHYSPPPDKKVCRRYEVDTKCYGRKDGRAL